MSAAEQKADWFTTRRFTLILGAMLLLSNWPVLLGDQAWFYRDYGFLGYPFAFFNKHMLLAGEFPFWNSLIHCGVPHFAQWNTMVLYPGSLIYVLFPMPWSLAWFCVLHILLGGVGMFRLGVARTESGFAGAVGGTAFAFCGMLLGSIIYPNYLVAFAWMPWMFLVLPGALDKGGREVVRLAIFSSLQMLSGAPELILMTWVLIAAIAIATARTKVAWNRAPLLNFVSVVVLISGLCAFQLLPFFELLGHSQRTESTGTGFWSLPAWGSINLTLPMFGSFRTVQGVHVQAGQSFLPSVYLGVVALALAVHGLLRGTQKDRLLLGAFGLVALLLSFGHAFVLYPLLEALAPVGFARFPVKALLPLVFIVPVLAMYGVVSWGNSDSIAGSRRSVWPGPVIVGGILLCGIGWTQVVPLFEAERTATIMNGLIRIGVLLVAVLLLRMVLIERLRRLGQLGLLAVIWMDGTLHLPVLNPTITAEAFQPNLVREFHAETFQPPPALGIGRLMVSTETEHALHTRMVPGFFEDFMGQRLAQWGNLNLLDGMPKMNGAATLVPRWANGREIQLYSNPGLEKPGQSDLGMSTVQYLTKPGQFTHWQRIEDSRPVVDGRGVAVISNLRFSNGRIAFQYAAKEAVHLKIVETYHPAWEAHFDGSVSSPELASDGFMTLWVPEGEGEVVLSYSDRIFLLGGIGSLVFAVFCFFLWRRDASSQN